jgi:exodeoxyribonuclease-1
MHPSGSCYDTEATDADVRHAQILQFGTIQTDRNLTEMSRKEVLVRRLPYVLPSREALAVTGFKPETLDAPERLSEYDAALMIERELKAKGYDPKLFITYNGISFDDELIRTTLFRNLRDPYVTSGRNAYRLDVLALARVARSTMPDILTIPIREDGSENWKLEAIAPANGVEITAHDAMGDCKATLDIAKRIKEKAEWLWKHAVAAGNTSRVDKQLSSAMADGRTVWVYTHFGAPDLAPCKVLATNNKKRWYLADIRRDDLPTNAEDVRNLLFTRDTPIKSIRAAAAPYVYEDSDALRILDGMGSRKIAERLTVGNSFDDVGKAVAEAILNEKYENGEDSTSEERIYDGFPGDRDRARKHLFHNSDSWADKSAIEFDDDRLSDFAGRLVMLAHMEGHEIPANQLERAQENCLDALNRAYVPEREAKWTTLEGELRDCDDFEYRAWAEKAFALDAPELAPREVPEMPGGHEDHEVEHQMSLGI